MCVNPTTADEGMKMCFDGFLATSSSTIIIERTMMSNETLFTSKYNRKLLNGDRGEELKEGECEVIDAHKKLNVAWAFISMQIFTHKRIGNCSRGIVNLDLEIVRKL
jgi:hypothetical protein